MLENYTAVIQAGGRGTRLRKLTLDRIPKPLLGLNGKPMMEWQIESLQKNGIREIVIIVGHLGWKIKEYFGDGSRWGVSISYIDETEPLGSAGSLYQLKGLTRGRDFILIFGDVMFDMDLARMARFHEEHGALATLAVHPNAHPYDSDLVVLGANGRVTGFCSKDSNRAKWYANLVNAGIYVLSGRLLEETDRLRGQENPQRADLEKDIIMPLVAGQLRVDMPHGDIRTDRYLGTVYGYRTTEYIKDAGMPERFYEVCREQEAGLWERKNLGRKQRCIFLDRDGTLNVYKGLIADAEALELEKNVAEAVRLINQSGYLTIVVTNQPVVARGMCGVADVEQIHRKLETLLGKEGAYLDDIIFCPHHPDRGYPEENAAYKIPCACRKPRTDMIERMAEKHNINLAESYMVGDSTRDIQTGINAGLKTILVKTGQAGTDGKYAAKADREAADLLEAVRLVLADR